MDGSFPKFVYYLSHNRNKISIQMEISRFCSLIFFLFLLPRIFLAWSFVIKIWFYGSPNLLVPAVYRVSLFCFPWEDYIVIAVDFIIAPVLITSKFAETISNFDLSIIAFLKFFVMKQLLLCFKAALNPLYVELFKCSSLALNVIFKCSRSKFLYYP